MGGVNAQQWPVPCRKVATYFQEGKEYDSWTKLLCCPAVMGCTVVLFNTRNPKGGEAQYKIKTRFSHSESIPRYELHTVDKGEVQKWIVAHLSKSETHYRAKPGEFVRVEVWELASNSMTFESRRRQTAMHCTTIADRPTPSAQDMKMANMCIVTQAKLERLHSRPKEPDRFDHENQKWVQTITVDRKHLRIVVERKKNRPEFKRAKDMVNMSIFAGEQELCRARKQSFAGTVGSVEQPYLGVQLNNCLSRTSDPIGGEELMGILNTYQLLLLSMCLAWSQSTMTWNTDLSQRFVNAMVANPGDPGSAEEMNLSVQWDTDDVKQRLKHVPHASFYNWVEAKEKEEEDEDEDSEAEAEV
mmetsp:Transcript_39895/g.87078  ORF Transcript_39895/g.87078 Transcript_39895/m.87078 type:complete len:358 (-) Transcript_39895:119-1192(-)